MNRAAGFGRRNASPPAPTAPRRPPPPGAAAEAAPPQDLGFLRPGPAGPLAEDEAFKAWRRRQAPGRLAAWVLTFALLAPGGVCFLLDVPTPVAAGVELAGVVIGWRLRRARRRHLSEIAGWEADRAPLAGP